MKAELVAAVGAELGEGATLFPDGSIWWVDLIAGKTYRWFSGENHVGPTYPHEVAKLLPASDSMIIVGQDQVFCANGTKLADIGNRESNLRGSDAVVLPDGSVAFGVLDRDLAVGKGSLIWLSQSGNLNHVALGATIPNGIAVMPDATTIVWCDSPTGRIDLFDFDPTNGFTNRRPFIQVPADLGVPDGLCVDSDGGVWVAMWGGGCVAKFSPTGKLDQTISLDAPHVTSCAFDSDDNLLITTACVILSERERLRYPGAGGLWSVPSNVHGVQRAPTFLASACSGSPKNSNN